MEVLSGEGQVSMSSKLVFSLGAAILATAMLAPQAEAAPRHKPGVTYGRHVASHRGAVRGGRYALVNEGPGTPYGFYPLPQPYRAAARVARWRQADAVHEAVETDALTSGGFRSGFLGDDVAGSVPYSGYGVFNGADGYGTPYFAGWYGPADGADYGPFGRAYTD